MLFAEAQAVRVAGVLEWWLREEMQDAQRDVADADRHIKGNAVLDDYARIRGELAAGSPGATYSAKDDSHWMRYKNKFGLYENGLDEADDYFLASITHHALMFVSGGFRRECMLSSANANEYRNRRAPGQSGTSLDILAEVTNTFSYIEQASLYGRSAVGAFVDYQLQGNQTILDLMQQIDANPISEGVALGQDHESMAAARRVQRLGLVMAVSNIVMVASLREEGYDGVPFLEPKSISTAVLDPNISIS